MECILAPIDQENGTIAPIDQENGTMCCNTSTLLKGIKREAWPFGVALENVKKKNETLHKPPGHVQSVLSDFRYDCSPLDSSETIRRNRTHNHAFNH